MDVKTTTNNECKPKATIKNLQFVENLDMLIDIAEGAEESDVFQEKEHRSSYDLVNIRYRYIDRYDWYDTIFEEDGKYGLKNMKGEIIVPARFDGFQEHCHFIYSRRVARIAQLRGKVGLVKADGSGDELTPFDYDSISYMIIIPYYMVKKGDKFGIIGMNGQIIAPFILDEVCIPSGSCVIFKADGKYGLIDSSCGDLYVEPQFDNIELVDMEQPYTMTKNGVEGVINEKGIFMTVEESIDYEGYLVGEYNPEI